MTAVKTPGGTHTVQFGTTPIFYDVLFSDRKTLSVHIDPDSSIVVDVPHGTAYHAIEDFVLRQGAWILRHLRELQQYPHPSAVLPRRYVSGESYRYLGRQYRLKVVQDSVERVVLSRGWITVGLADTHDPSRVRALLSAWYRRHAERVFAERLDACYLKVTPLGIARPRLSIRAMKRRWGSCSPAGTLTLNLKLIQAPRNLIDYVIIHELCHLKELNHSRRFWRLLRQVLPDWERLREALNQYQFSNF